LLLRRFFGERSARRTAAITRRFIAADTPAALRRFFLRAIVASVEKCPRTARARNSGWEWSRARRRGRIDQVWSF